MHLGQLHKKLRGIVHHGSKELKYGQTDRQTSRRECVYVRASVCARIKNATWTAFLDRPSLPRHEVFSTCCCCCCCCTLLDLGPPFLFIWLQQQLFHDQAHRNFRRKKTFINEFYAFQKCWLAFLRESKIMKCSDGFSERMKSHTIHV